MIISRKVKLAIGILSICVLQAIAGSIIWKAGNTNGLDTYHEFCYNVGGVVQRPSDNTVVLCRRGGQPGGQEL